LEARKDSVALRIEQVIWGSDGHTAKSRKIAEVVRGITPNRPEVIGIPVVSDKEYVAWSSILNGRGRSS
jgi:hypothetical protein